MGGHFPLINLVIHNASTSHPLNEAIGRLGMREYIALKTTSAWIAQTSISLALLVVTSQLYENVMYHIDLQLDRFKISRPETRLGVRRIVWLSMNTTAIASAWMVGVSSITLFLTMMVGSTYALLHKHKKEVPERAVDFIPDSLLQQLNALSSQGMSLAMQDLTEGKTTSKSPLDQSNNPVETPSFVPLVDSRSGSEDGLALDESNGYEVIGQEKEGEYFTSDSDDEVSDVSDSDSEEELQTYRQKLSKGDDSMANKMKFLIGNLSQDEIQDIESWRKKMSSIKEYDTCEILGHRVGVAQELGGKPTQEDRFIAGSFKLKSGEAVSCFGVFDGHGGTRTGLKGDFVANYLQQRILKTVEEGLNKVEEELSCTSSKKNSQDALLNAIKYQMKVEFNLLNLTLAEKNQVGKVGSTACVAFIYKGVLYVVNTGDSRAVVWDGDKVIEMTQDAKAISEEDVKKIMDSKRKKVEIDVTFLRRILKEGGTLSLDLEDNKWVSRTNGLSTARALGDTDIFGVVATPKVSAYSITDKQFQKEPLQIFIGCDGMFDINTSQQLIEEANVLNTQAPNNLSSIAGALIQGVIHKTEKSFAERIVTEEDENYFSKKIQGTKYGVDNCTLMIVDLKQNLLSDSLKDVGRMGVECELCVKRQPIARSSSTVPIKV